MAKELSFKETVTLEQARDYLNRMAMIAAESNVPHGLIVKRYDELIGCAKMVEELFGVTIGIAPDHVIIERI